MPNWFDRLFKDHWLGLLVLILTRTKAIVGMSKRLVSTNQKLIKTCQSTVMKIRRVIKEPKYHKAFLCSDSCLMLLCIHKHLVWLHLVKSLICINDNPVKMPSVDHQSKLPPPAQQSFAHPFYIGPLLANCLLAANGQLGHQWLTTVA